MMAHEIRAHAWRYCNAHLQQPGKGKIHGDAKMDIDYRFPAYGYWKAGSRHDASSLAKLFHRLMNIRGVKVSGDYQGSPLKGYDVKLDLGGSVSIKFLDDQAGSTLTISVFVNDADCDIFVSIWKGLIARGYVFDDRFERDQVLGSNVTSAENIIEDKAEELKLPWDHMPDASAQERVLVMVWCKETFKGKHVASTTGYSSPGNILCRLRKRYPNAEIPKGQIERKQFREMYKAHKNTSLKARAVKSVKEK